MQQEPIPERRTGPRARARAEAELIVAKGCIICVGQLVLIGAPP